MLIKIEISELRIPKDRLTMFELDFIRFMSIPADVEMIEGEYAITLKGTPSKLYQMIFFISKECDIEIM